MSDFGIELLIGCVLCLVHLGIGIGIGCKIPRSSGLTVAFTAQASPTQTCGDRTAVQRQWFDMRLRLSDLARCAREAQQVPLDIPAHWRSELVHVANELHQILEHKLLGTESKPRRASQPQRTPVSNQTADPEDEHQNKVTTNAQILALLDGEGFSCERDGASLPLTRYKFSVMQPLATHLSGGPMPADAFSMVQCHDLSVRDIRYFVHDLPTEDKVVFGLGVPNPVIFFAARVEDFHRAYMYGRFGYLVTARLVAVIDKRGDVNSPELVGHSNGG